MRVAKEDGEQLAIAEVKGDQANGALTGELVVAKDARARSRSSLLFLES